MGMTFQPGGAAADASNSDVNEAAAALIWLVHCRGGRMDSAAGDDIPAGGTAADASNSDANEAAASPPEKKTWQRKMPK